MRARLPSRSSGPAILLAIALAAPVLVPVPVHAQASTGASPTVDGLEVNADAGVSPGSTLEFLLRGTPHGQARIQLTGTAASVALQEGAPGVYTGRYTVARDEPVDVHQPIQATLRANGRMVISRFDFPAGFVALRDARRAEPPAITAATAPRTAASPSAAIAPTSTLGAAPATMAPLTLQVSSPALGTTVDSAQVVVQGRATPNALVHVQVHAIPPVPPGRAAVALPVSEQSVQADAAGNFSFGLGAQRVPPGARLELDLDATQGDRTTPMQRYVLYQFQG